MTGSPHGTRGDSRVSAHSKSAESGYAMLLVFAMSAMIAIGLYQQLPRAAFESQREKEQLLIDHGEQYKRAIQLYYRKFARYPAKIEDLENTQNIRFLRRRFRDPMTGKDEWRLVHMGPGGQLVDSLVKKQDDANKQQWNNQSITEFKPAGSDSSSDQTVNLALRRRPSDDQTANSSANPGGGTNGAADSSNPLTASNSPSPNVYQPGIPGGVNQPGATGQRFTIGPNGQLIPAGANNSGSSSFGSYGQASSTSGGSSIVSGNGGYGSSSVGGNGGYGSSANQTPTTPTGTAGTGVSSYGAPVNSQYQGQSPTTYSTNSGSNQQTNTGFTQPGTQVTPSQMINNLLTQPRPGGAPSGIGTPVSGSTGGTTVGGLAGVATTYKGKGIHVYNDQDEYQKWEFYYDVTKDVSVVGQSTGVAGATAATGTQQTNSATQQTITNQMNSSGFNSTPQVTTPFQLSH